MKEVVHIKSISEVHRILGIEKPKHPLVSVLKMDSRITNFDFGDDTYVLDFYQISFKEGLSGSFQYGRSKYDFDEGSLVFTKPKQTIQMDSEIETNSTSGWILLFHPDLIRKSELGRTIEKYSFFDYDLNEALHLSDKERTSLTDLVIKIEEEYNNNIDKHSWDIIVGNIEMIVKYSKRYYERQFYTRKDLNTELLTKFNRILKHYYSSEQPINSGVLTVKYCANQLNLSVNYLGDLLKSDTGRSAKDHINDYVIEKAKTLLLSNNENIGQISYRLGYENPQGLNKLFKAKVGLSPSQFRTIN
jgi:AraC-like DNA-binding protein